jgi:hypothetical protein
LYLLKKTRDRSTVLWPAHCGHAPERVDWTRMAFGHRLAAYRVKDLRPTDVWIDGWSNPDRASGGHGC